MFTTTYAHGHMLATSYAKASQGPRKSMEDTHVIHKVSDSITLLAVFDGHGGAQVANLCKQNVGQVFANIVLQYGCHHMERNLLKTYAELDDMAYTSFEDESVGATAAIVLITPDRVWFSNCGDTMSLVGMQSTTATAAKKQSARFMSENHRVDNEKDRVEAAGSRIIYLGGCLRVDGGLNIARSIGDHYIKNVVISQPYITSYPLYGKGRLDYALIASDGLWDVFDEEAADAKITSLRQQHGQNIHAVLNGMIKLAYGRGSADNITLLMTLFH